MFFVTNCAICGWEDVSKNAPKDLACKCGASLSCERQSAVGPETRWANYRPLPVAHHQKQSAVGAETRWANYRPLADALPLKLVKHENHHGFDFSIFTDEIKFYAARSVAPHFLFPASSLEEAIETGGAFLKKINK
jgi:hypothetical protein